MAWPLLCSLASLALAPRSRLPASPRMAAAPLVVDGAHADRLTRRRRGGRLERRATVRGERHQRVFSRLALGSV